MIYQVVYNCKVIKEFDDRQKAIMYVDSFFKSNDYDRSSSNVDIYLDDRKIYSAYLNIAYKE